MSCTPPSQPLGAGSRSKVRRRAKHVCVRCNEKKIRCDLDQRPQNKGPCMNCSQSSAECRYRPSHRNLHRRRRPAAASLPDADNVASLSLDIASLPHIDAPRTAALDPTDHQSITVHDPCQSSSGPVSLEGQAHEPPPPGVQSMTHDQSARLGEHGNSPEDLFGGRRELENPQTASSGQESYLGESGYMPVFSHTRVRSTARPAEPMAVNIQYTISPLQPTLYMSYADAFFRECYCFCPILDRPMLELPEYKGSLLLQQALALVGSVVQPSLLYSNEASSHYDKAKLLLHLGAESNPLAALVSVMLFYWWNTCSPTIVSMNGPWWWTGVAIRQAQELGLHREPRTNRSLRTGESGGLRRRIWWTLFARERLTSICQGRPYMINPLDCDIREPSLEDFPDSSDPQARQFLEWVRLCSIVGRVGDYLRRKVQRNHSPDALLDELTSWVHGLPAHLQLPFSTFPTENFNRSISQLHLPYLSCITLLFFKRSRRSVPIAYSPAILAASCTARIFEDFLARGSLRFLQGMAGWHISIALLALLYARQVKGLEGAANPPFDVLRVALKEMAQRWPSAHMYDQGVDKLVASQAQQRQKQQQDREPRQEQDAGRLDLEGDEILTMSDLRARPAGARRSDAGRAQGGPQSPPTEVTADVDDIARYFPAATKDTSPLFSILLSSAQESVPFHESDAERENDLGMLLFDFFDPVTLDLGVNYGQPAEFADPWDAGLQVGFDM